MTTQIDRRSFLKKAGLAAGAAAAVYAVPSITTVGSKPAYAAVTSVHRCYSVQIDACPYERGYTKVRFAVCNLCNKDVSFVAFETFPQNPVTKPPEGQWHGPQLNGTWLVEYTSGSGNPSYPAIKFESLGDHGFKDGKCEYFTVDYDGDLRGTTLKVRVTGKHSTIEETLELPL